VGRRPWKVVSYEADKYVAGNDTPVAHVSVTDKRDVSDLDWLIISTTDKAVDELRPGAAEETRWLLTEHCDTHGRPGTNVYIVLPDLVGLDDGSKEDPENWDHDPEGQVWKFLEARLTP